MGGSELWRVRCPCVRVSHRVETPLQVSPDFDREALLCVDAK